MIEYVTRDDVNKLANWVFGPEGFPQLLVFAYGDFTFKRSCQDYNVLYCRNDRTEPGEDEPKYKVLDASNKVLWDFVLTNMDVLSACPYRSTTQPMLSPQWNIL